MIARITALAALLAAGLAQAQTVPTLPRSGQSAGGVPLVAPRDLELTFGKYADYSALANATARSGGIKSVFIGGVGSQYYRLGNPANVPQMLAAGNVGLYQHANGNASLTAAQRQAMWATWGITGVTATGQGETVAEIGGGSNLPDAAYLSYFGGAYPIQANMNIISGDGQGSGTYTAGSSEAVPGHVYSGYTTDADLAQMKVAIDKANGAGSRNIAIFMTPNYGNADLDNPFATAPFWKNVRAAALYGGGVALDVPPTYWQARGAAYRSMISQMAAWGAANGLRVSLTVSPYAIVMDASMNLMGCGYDTMMLANTQLLVTTLKAANALPSQWVVENYCGTTSGTPNDIATDTTAGSLNELALYLARTVRPAPPGSTPAGANGVPTAATISNVRTGPLRLSDVLGAGTMAGQDAGSVAISGGSITGDTAISVTAIPLFQNGLVVQGTGTAAVLDGNTAGQLGIYRPGGGPMDLYVASIGATSRRPDVIATNNLDVRGAVYFSGTLFQLGTGLPTSDPHVISVMWDDPACNCLRRSKGP